MAGDPDVISFIESLQKGSSVYYVEFPELFLEAPSVITELNNDLTSAIVPYIVSGVSNSGFYVNFGSALSFDGYELSVNAEVTGVRDIDSDVSSLAFKDLSLDDDVSSLAAQNTVDSTDISSLAAKDTDLDVDVSSLTAKDAGLDVDVSSLAAQNTIDSTDISSLAAKDTDLDVDVSSLTAQDAIFSSKDLSLDTDVSSLSAQDVQLETDISSLAANPLSANTEISSLAAKDTQLENDLSGLAINPLSGSVEISSLAAKDISLDTDVSSLAASPALDTSEISSLSKAVEDLSNLVASIGLENPVSYNGTDLGVLATKIYDEELGFHTGQERTTEIGLISNWLEGHLGELNTLIFTSFSGYNPENFNLEEQAILREMYLAEYNRKAHRNVLRGIVGTDSSSDFQVIREGDSMIQKPNKNIAAKSLYDSYQSSQNKVKDLVYAYNLYGAKPSQVVGGDAPTTGSNPSLDGYYR